MSDDHISWGQPFEKGPAPTSAIRHAARHFRVARAAWQLLDASAVVIVFLALALVFVVI